MQSNCKSVMCRWFSPSEKQIRNEMSSQHFSLCLNVGAKCVLGFIINSHLPRPFLLGIYLLVF